MTPAFFEDKRGGFLILYDLESHTNAFRISGDMLPLIYGVTNNIALALYA
jgi:hypothetical protein